MKRSPLFPDRARRHHVVADSDARLQAPGRPQRQHRLHAAAKERLGQRYRPWRPGADHRHHHRFVGHRADRRWPVPAARLRPGQFDQRFHEFRRERHQRQRRKRWIVRNPAIARLPAHVLRRLDDCRPVAVVIPPIPCEMIAHVPSHPSGVHLAFTGRHCHRPGPGCRPV